MQYKADIINVLTMLQQNRLKLKPEKCYFYVKEVIFLRYIIIIKRIRINPQKLN